MRAFWVVVGFLCLFILESSLFASFPKPFMYFPVVVSSSVYLIQRYSISYAVVWIVLHGILLDLLGLSMVPASFIAYGFAAVVAIASSRSLFSNRSFYGVAGATIATLSSLAVSQLIILFILIFFQFSTPDLFTFFHIILWQHVLSICILIILYPFTKHLSRTRQLFMTKKFQ